MSAHDKKSCEIWTGARWEVWPVSAAYPYRKETLIRCHECKGPILLMQASSDGRNAAHFEHKPSHSGCSLVHSGYSGTRSLHPDAVQSPRRSQQLALTDYIPDQAAEEMIGPVTETMRQQLMLARVGQGRFRRKLLDRWKSCSVLACGPETTLVASHIVPWRECHTNEERLDPNNGLLLSPNLDRLFDRKLISFSDDGALVVSPLLRAEDARALGIQAGMRLRAVPSGILKFLRRHREGSQWMDADMA